MRFAHLADIHLGSWKELKLCSLSERAFKEAIDRCIDKKVDFVLIAGDMFNTSVPPIESLKFAVQQLKKLKDNNILTYSIAGSHDFSPSGKTMLDVLEEADLLVNVCKGEVQDGKLKLDFTTDEKTGAKITGIIGKKGMLDKKYYESLVTDNLIAEKGFKIFMFHTAISELKTEDLEKMEASPLSLLPKGFNYYAGGHVHIIKKADIDEYRNVVYPGPIFPNSFSEIEKLGNGGFFIYDNGKIDYQDLIMCETETIDIDCNHKIPAQITEEIIENAMKSKIAQKLVLLRLSGTIESGKTNEINLTKIIELLMEKGAYFVMKNTNKLASKEFEEVKVKADSAEEAEKLVIAENIGQVAALKLGEGEEKELVQRLMTLLDVEKEEGEKQADYEAKVLSQIGRTFERK